MKVHVATRFGTHLASQSGWDAWQGHLRAFGGLQGHCGQGVLGTPRARLVRPTPAVVQVGAGFRVGCLGPRFGSWGLLQVAAGLASGCCRACCCTRILPQACFAASAWLLRGGSGRRWAAGSVRGETPSPRPRAVLPHRRRLLFACLSLRARSKPREGSGLQPPPLHWLNVSEMGTSEKQILEMKAELDVGT